MIRLFYFFVIYLSCISARLQVVLSGKVLDKQTEEPISYVHIYNSDLGIGTTSNIKGEFNLKSPDSIKVVNLIFSHVGYKVNNKAIEFNPSESLVIILEPSPTLLEEVTVSPRNSLDLIKKCIEHSTINYPTDGFKASGFQREVTKSNGAYVQLVEAAYASYYVKGLASTTLLDGRFAENKPFRINDNLWNDKRGGFYVFGLTALGDLNIPFQHTVLGVDIKDIDQLSNYYKLEFAGTIELETGKTYIIHFHPKEDIKKSLIEGTIYIDSDTYALVELSYKMSESGKRYLKMNERWNGQVVSTSPSSKKVKILDETRHIRYRPFKGKWYLSSIIQDIQFTAAVKLPLKTIAKSSLLELHVEQVISRLELEVHNTPRKEIPTDMYYYQTYLKNNHENYESYQWDTFGSIKSHIEYSTIVDNLKKVNNKTN